MIQYVLKEPVEPSFEKVGVTGRIFPASSLTDKVEFFTVETERGHETTIIEHACDFCYYILEGAGSFQIEGAEHKCEKGDLVIIPHGMRFSYKGKLRMFAASAPPWGEDQEETLKIKDK